MGFKSSGDKLSWFSCMLIPLVKVLSEGIHEALPV